ncbi:glycoside hydrolase family 19 protein [Vibrio sp. TBV020]|uniref:glycoside hydrolase family 19 protein n=1 Tax=Vibrio sp. TBV020 TaxID=3137398 RepID=UPI0038CD255F
MKNKNLNLSKLTLTLIASGLVSTGVYAAPNTAPSSKTVPNAESIAVYNHSLSNERSFAKQAAQREIYSGWDQLPVFDVNKTYERADSSVKFTDGQRWGVFKNKWWVKGESPSFIDANGAWELVSETDISGHYLPESVTVNNWISSSAYSAGDKVKHSINGEVLYFEAKYWTQGTEPALTVSNGGTAQDWETPWNQIDGVSDDVTPPVTPDPDPEPPVTTDPETPVTPDPEPELPITPDPEPEIPVTPEPELPGELWNSTTAYVAGDRVKHTIDGSTLLFEARYWTKGDKPVLTVSSGGTLQDWETPWQVVDGVAPEPEPEVPVEPEPELPVTPDPEPEVPVTPDPETPVIDPPTDLPADGYEFLSELTNEHWDWFFPMRSGRYNVEGGTRNQPPFALADGSTDTFNLDAFKRAVLEYNTWAESKGYKQFLNEGTKSQQALEFTSFWAKSSRETSGSWDNAPAPWIVNDKDAGIVWKGALYWVEEVGYSTNPDGTSPAINYVDAGSTAYPPAEGRSYYGRGIIQLSWNYNYGAFSYWLYDNGMMRDLITERDTLLKRPDYVASRGDLSILSGIWFWMTPQGAKPSSHDVMMGNITHVSSSSQELGLPQRNDGGSIVTAEGESYDEAVISYRLGTVTNIVNGGLECNKAASYHTGPTQRASYYNAYAKYMNASINGIQVPTVQDSTNVWSVKVNDQSPDNLKTSTCYAQKSYYGW